MPRDLSFRAFTLTRFSELSGEHALKLTPALGFSNGQANPRQVLYVDSTLVVMGLTTTRTTSRTTWHRDLRCGD